jgi:hypothetical protein
MTRADHLVEEYIMTDPYRITDEPQTDATVAPGNGRSGVFRTLIWLVLVVSAVGNSVASFADVSPVVHTGLGAIALLCVVTLITQHVRGRR